MDAYPKRFPWVKVPSPRQSPATVHLDVELIVAGTGAVDVDTLRVVHVSGTVDETIERAVEPDVDLHVVV